MGSQGKDCPAPQVSILNLPRGCLGVCSVCVVVTGHTCLHFCRAVARQSICYHPWRLVLKRQRADGVPDLRGAWRSQRGSRRAGDRIPGGQLLLPRSWVLARQSRGTCLPLVCPCLTAGAAWFPAPPGPRLLSWLHSTGQACSGLLWRPQPSLGERGSRGGTGRVLGGGHRSPAPSRPC